MKPIYEAWEAYREINVPKTASAQQVQETRRAFYAGTVMMNHIFFEFMHDSITPERVYELMASVETEVKDFVTLMKMGVV